MANELLTKISNICIQSKGTIVEQAPHLLAAAGVGSFVAGTVCAAKETPDALTALEKKEAIDPGLTKLEKAAVMAPKYVKTLGFTALGLALTIGAWTVEGRRMAALSAIAAAAITDKSKFEAATRAIVGDKTAEDIKKTAESYKNSDMGWDIPDRARQVPCNIEFTGAKFFSSYDDIVAGMNKSVEDLIKSPWNRIYMPDVYKNLHAGDCENTLGWSLDQYEGECLPNVKPVAATKLLGYRIEPWEDEYHRFGWNVIFANEPEKLD